MTKPVDGLSQWFTRLAYRLHPALGSLYENHYKFFNDGFVELICLVIANAFTYAFSFYAIGLPLVFLLITIATPLTFTLKYLLHKYWVWNRE